MMLSMGRETRPRGKPQNFTPEQNDALRRALNQYMRENQMSQSEMGKILHIEQQNVGRLMNSLAQGFSYTTATRLVRRMGFIGVDAFFEVRSVALDKKAHDVDRNVDARQADAMAHARALGVSEKAIQLVNKRIDKVNYYSSAWWCTQYLNQQESLDEARKEMEAERPKPAERKSEPAPKSSRSTGTE